jgi:hypothetical protein
VKALAFVPNRDLRQAVGGLEAELVDETDVQSADKLSRYWRSRLRGNGSALEPS